MDLHTPQASIAGTPRGRITGRMAEPKVAATVAAPTTNAITLSTAMRRRQCEAPAPEPTTAPGLRVAFPPAGGILFAARRRTRRSSSGGGPVGADLHLLRILRRHGALLLAAALAVLVLSATVVAASGGAIPKNRKPQVASAEGAGSSPRGVARAPGPTRL